MHKPGGFMFKVEAHPRAKDSALLFRKTTPWNFFSSSLSTPPLTFTMRSSTDFKIIIVGGGIAGLTLALMLEKFDIDYILLEARKEFAPQIGASIGMLPNGLLILDQLGCYEDISAKAMGYSFDDMHVRAANGQTMIRNKNLITHLQKR
jgi:hypothetical protein